MQVKWLRKALQNLDDEAEYIAQEDPAAAEPSPLDGNELDPRVATGRMHRYAHRGSHRFLQFHRQCTCRLDAAFKTR